MASRHSNARVEIIRLRKSLDEVFERADDKHLELEMRADLAKFACMRLTGFLEQALVSLGRHCAVEMSGGQAQSFLMSHLERTFNPNPDAVLKFIGRFDSNWRSEVEELLKEEERGQTLSSLVGIRNQIAHGISQGVSIERLRDYRKAVDYTVDFLLDRFAPLKTRQ